RRVAPRDPFDRPPGRLPDERALHPPDEPARVDASGAGAAARPACGDVPGAREARAAGERGDAQQPRLRRRDLRRRLRPRPRRRPVGASLNDLLTPLAIVGIVLFGVAVVLVAIYLARQALGVARLLRSGRVEVDLTWGAEPLEAPLPAAERDEASET